VTLAVALLLVALLLPSSAWIASLGAPAPQRADKLIAGASLLRASLASLGVFLILGAYQGWWRSVPAPSRRIAATASEATFAWGLLTVGAGLRLYALNRGLWVDEVLTLVEYVRPPLREIVTTYGSQNQHFLFSILAHGSISTFGESIWSLRLPAALFGIATLWAFRRLGLELTTPREALLAMAMLTFSYHHIWFSQNARGYSALLFWTVVSSIYLIRGLREQSRGPWVAYAVTVALGMYTHLTMGFVVAGQFAVYVADTVRRTNQPWSERIVPLFGGFGLAGLLTIVCYAIVLPQMPEAAGADLSSVAAWRSPAWMFQEMGRSLNLGPLLSLVAAVGLLVVASGIVSYWRESPALPLLLTVPTILGAATMFALGHHLWPRFFFFAGGFGILTVVRGLTVVTQTAGSWWRFPARRANAFATAATLLATLLLGRSIPYVYRPKQDFAGARDFVEAARRPGDAIVSVGVASLSYRSYFAPEWSTASTLAELEAIRKHSARTWLVYTLPIAMESDSPDIYAVAQKEFQLIRTFDGSVGDGAIYVRLAGNAGPGTTGDARKEGG
jgi:mannosyltransferase